MKTPNQTQSELLLAVRTGDNPEALEIFGRIYSPMIQNFGVRMGLQEADSLDIAQEVLLVAQTQVREGRYDPKKGRFRGWLYGITRRKVLKLWEDRKRPSRVQLATNESGADLLSILPDQQQERDKKIWEQEWRYALVNEALHHVREQPGISGKVFETFILFVQEQMPAEKVAQILDLSPSSVYVYKGRVMDAIQKWIEQYEDDHGVEDPMEE